MKIAIISSVFLLFSAVLPGQKQMTPAPVQQYAPSGHQPLPAPPASILPGAAQMNLYLPLLQGKSVAVFANQTSMVNNTHLVDTLMKRGIHIKKIFSPEHGFRGDADAGEHVSSLADPKTGIPIISLYGSKDQPSAADLQDVDMMLFDIQDVGVRFYTYISSLQRYLESAIINHRPVIVLDRPDTNGSYVDGPVLDPKFKSFVGMQPVPVVYGMTIGEYCRMLVGEQGLDTAADAAGARDPQHISRVGFSRPACPCRGYPPQHTTTTPHRPPPHHSTPHASSSQP